MRLPLLLTLILAAATAASYHNARDTMLWWLEAAPVLVGFAILAATSHVFPLTSFAYVLIFISFLMMLLGAHYTYEHVPLFSRLKEEYSLSRNYYDRVGHFVQGVVPAIVLREVLLRKDLVKKGPALFSLIVMSCLGFAGMYEIAEWLGSYTVPDATANWFLGLQGDEWDTQKDMALATLGAASSLLVFGRAHDRALARFA